MNLPDGHPARQNLLIIREAGEKAAVLTHQLLAFSRKQVLEMKAINLNTIVEKMAKMLARVIGEDVVLHLNTKSPARNIMADLGQIEQVLMNLAVNARDAMPAGGRLIIEISDIELDGEYVKKHEIVKPGPYVMLAVSDTGEGMSKNVMDRIFDPFFTTKEVGRGTGLGLATVYGIVKQHNGYIFVYSEPGKGTTFKIYLPATHEKSRGTQTAVSGAMPQGTETVLVADDEPDIRNLVLDVLRPLGYHVLLAASGEEALTASDALKGPVDLLLTDVVMPGMDGKKLADELCSRRPDVKVIFMSGYTDDAIAHHGILDSGVILIQKPLTPGVLARKIREVLDKKR
jgi:CheY-like chemotaxis protein